ncbi:hypothetical protein BA177_06630 [Woeseia oceani]|uniref:Sugar transporter n=1 Tax=Woeseia oceani TaxID=1548547 RepID=A0A193LEI6_9GAMM|nr:hypothetical protein BA177_06630 [Woeseia oceani]
MLGWLWAAPVVAQVVNITPEQQRLLDSLPAAQRESALRQLRQLRSGSSDKQNESTDVEQVRAEKSQGDEGVLRTAMDGPLRFVAGDTVIVGIDDSLVARTDFRDAEEEIEFRDRVQRLRDGNPYQLNSRGQLQLPGIRVIGLAGLTEEQGTLRLQAEPVLSGMEINITLLPLTPIGEQALEPFGYELFSGEVGQKGDDTRRIPVPTDYTVGPGDNVRIRFFGNRNAEYDVQVERDGTIVIPEIGPVAIGGLSFLATRQAVEKRVTEQMIGTQVSITLGELRAVQVFLVGDVKKPGSYSVGALSTMTTVLSTGGGIARQGSLRRIELKRAGKTVGELDVYDLLLNGDTRQDLRIQEGDVIFVPPVGKRVKIVGEVNRPAIYEMHDSASVQDVIRMAGGMTAEAVATDITIERVVPDKGLVTIEPDLDRTGGNVTAALDGDLIRIPTAIRVIDKAVTVVGNVHYPVYAEWRSGLRLSDVIPSARILRPNSDINYVLIQREPVPNVGMDALSADLESAWKSPGSVADPLLEPRDRIFVFDLQVGRAHIMGPILEEMQLRTSRDRKMRVVTIDGSVNAPGDVPLEPGMRIADLIRAGGGLAQSAYIEEAELTRYELNDAGEREARLISVDLAAALAGETAANLLLQPFDFMNIRETPNWTKQSFIELRGEVRFPGRYTVNNGESISDILERAGGLTSRAFPSGSVFTRESLKKRERDQILKLASRIELDLASLSLSDSGPSNAIGVGQSLLGQLRSTEPTGRLVIDLPSVTGRDRSADILVEDGDFLLVPRQPQEVTVIGEVQFSTSHVWQPGYNRGDYLARSGGMTNKADDKRIYIVRANGEVISGKESRFFAGRDRTQILAGDTIVVPLDTERVRPLTLWTSASQIVYNLAIAATAVSRF